LQFTANQDVLNKAVATVARAVSNRSTLPILSHILLVVEEEQLVVSATDLEIGMRQGVPLNPLDTIQPGRTTVPSRLFNEIIAAMPKGQAITIGVDENDRVTLRSGKSVLEVHGLPAQEFPPLPECKGTDAFDIPAAEFERRIGQCLVAVSSDETRARLTGMQVIAEERFLRLVATDTHRLATGTVAVDEDMPPLRMIIPARAVAEVARAIQDADSIVAVKMTESQVQFTFEAGLTIVSRLIEGEFPNWKKVVPSEHAWSISGNRGHLLQAVRRCAIVSREDVHRILVTLTCDGGLRLAAQSSKVGKCDEEVEGLDVQRNGGELDELAIAFNAEYLMDALTTIDADEVRIELTLPNQPIMVRGVSEEPFQMVQMPMQTT